MYIQKRVSTCNGNKIMKIIVEGVSGKNILSHPQGGNFEFKMIF